MAPKQFDMLNMNKTKALMLISEKKKKDVKTHIPVDISEPEILTILGTAIMLIHNSNNSKPDKESTET